MASTIKVDNVQNQPGTNIVSKCGTDVTIGASGDTVALACGASQTGFGRTGTVDWVTTPVTSTPTTGVSGKGYFLNTTAQVLTINLPASPSAGDIMAVKDYTGTFATYPCTVGRNSSNIRGATNDIELNLDNAGATFVYVDGTEGWQIFYNGSDSDGAETYVCASVSGACNTLTTAPCCANMKLATFSGPGSFTVNSLSSIVANNAADFVVVGGGGGGGSGISGGGGAGGYLFSDGTATGCYTAGPAPLGRCAVTLVAQVYPIAAGGGGTGQVGPGSTTTPPGRSAGNGTPSTSLGLTATGGGFGGNGQAGGGCNNIGGPGGSGGGGGYDTGPSPVGQGNTPPVSPPQGNDGANGSANPSYLHCTGGGGGASAAGEGGTAGSGAGDGGDGLANSITGASVSRGGGGGGGPYGPLGRAVGVGGTGGGGNGGLTYAPGCATSGTVNTGGGGGGGGESPNPSPSPTSNNSGPAGNGGSGIVIIRYKFQ
jgi:hypothetical protein